MKQPIRVAFLIDRLRRAGTEAQLVALLHGLDRRRVEPHLILLDGTDPESQALEPAVCPVLRLGVRSFKHWRTPIKGWQLGQYLRKHRIEVLQSYFLDSVYFGVPIARLAGVNTIVRVRNNLGYWLTPWHRRVGRWYGRWVGATLTNSDAGRAALIEAEGLAPERIIVLENGVDTERFSASPPPFVCPHYMRIGAVANLRPVKRLDLLIRAVAEICPQFPQVRLVVAGDGPQRKDLERLTCELGLIDHVEFLGAVTDVPALLASLDIAVLCSDSEGMSNALLEYMAAGRAIVATRVGANDRLIRADCDGLLIEPGSVMALAAGLRHLLEDPERARRLGASARQRVVDTYSRAAACRRFEDFYENLVHVKPARAA